MMRVYSIGKEMMWSSTMECSAIHSKDYSIKPLHIYICSSLSSDQPCIKDNYINHFILPSWFKLSLLFLVIDLFSFVRWDFSYFLFCLSSNLFWIYFSSLISSTLFFSYSCCLLEILWKRHCPTRMRASPGTMSKYPTKVHLPGILWISDKSRMREAMNGSRVMARAGMIGSGNILVIIKMEISWPSERMIAMNMKPEKWRFENRLQIPQKESNSKLHPWRKKLENAIKMHVRVLAMNMDRKGG